MAKEPARRYVSVDQMREDLERHMSGRPIHAQADDWSYRAGKFIRRNRLAVSAAVLIAVSIAAGVLGTLQQGRIAQENLALLGRQGSPGVELVGPVLQRLR